jgi:amino acid transporter
VDIGNKHIISAFTYLFVGSLFAAIAIGLFKAFAAGGHPVPLEPLPRIATAPGPTTWLVLQAFASGCTAMTGVEAVSNGVKAFRES